jgi:hypothetical protein
MLPAPVLGLKARTRFEEISPHPMVRGWSRVSGARTENLAFCQSGPPIRAARYGISIARKNRPALVALTFSTRTWPLVSTSGLANNVQLPMGCVTFVVL